jgi:PIN domain nuclease of toxin-antitoxin system
MEFVQVIVLDTHIWLWWINSDTRILGVARQEHIARADVVAVSAISCFEVAWLARHMRIDLPCQPTEWFDKALGQSGITLLPLTPAIAARAVNLHDHHGDPQDRIIIATAIEHSANLMSDDSKFSKYAELDGRLL